MLNMMRMKKCSQCGDEKPATEEFFPPFKPSSRGLRKRKHDAFSNPCRVCRCKYLKVYNDARKLVVNAAFRQRYADDPSFRAQKQSGTRQYYVQHPDRAKAASARWALKHPEKALKAKLKHGYKMPLAEYERLYDVQGGRCAICRSIPVGRRLHVDHDHKTGQLRQLLCMRCNLGLGHFLDDPTALRAAADYIEKNKQTEKLAEVIQLRPTVGG